jgi:hypothetical protein
VVEVVGVRKQPARELQSVAEAERQDEGVVVVGCRFVLAVVQSAGQGGGTPVALSRGLIQEAAAAAAAAVCGGLCWGTQIQQEGAAAVDAGLSCWGTHAGTLPHSHHQV